MHIESLFMKTIPIQCGSGLESCHLNQETEKKMSSSSWGILMEEDRRPVQIATIPQDHATKWYFLVFFHPLSIPPIKTIMSMSRMCIASMEGDKRE